MKNSILNSKAKQLEQILNSSSLIKEALLRVRDLGLKDYYIGAGCITQTVWNHMFEKEVDYGIKDIDFVYFDGENTDFDSEKGITALVCTSLKDLKIKVDVKNQARVHLWYHEKFGSDIMPYSSLEEAILTWPTTATAIGVRLEVDGTLTVFAPFGLEDLFAGVVRANKAQITEDIYNKKVMSWKLKWPELDIMEW